MNFKPHLLSGIIGGIGFSVAHYYWYSDYDYLLSASNGLIVLGASLAPDIDTGSIPSRIFAWLGIFTSCFLLYFKFEFAAAIIGIVYMAFSSDKHRGFTHKWALPISFIIAYFLTKEIWLISFAIGLIIHYIVDRIPPYKIL